VNDTQGKKKLFWAGMFVVPVLFFVTLEFVLRWAHYGENLDFVFEQEVNGKQYYTINSKIARRYFPGQPQAAPRVYDDSFEKVKSPNTYRIFCLGESTMQGYPYEYNGALPRLIKDQLTQRIPDKNIEVINLGITAINSYAVRDVLNDVLQYQPDLIIVYLGHNEFYGSFGVGSVEYLGTSRTFIKWYLAISRFKVFEMMRDALQAVRNVFGSKREQSPPLALMEILAKERTILYGSEMYETAKKNFRENLSEIVDAVRAQNIPIILSTVVSNVRDREPFVSAFSPETSLEKQKEWLVRYQRGVHFLKKNNVVQALQEFEQAKQIDSMRADVHYQMGLCNELLGKVNEAKSEYERARDLDALRFRASGEFNEIIKSVGQQRGAWVVDVVKTFEDSSLNRLIGGQWMLEHVHPNLDGYFLIAKEFVRTMNEHDCIVPRAQWKEPYPDDVIKANSFMTAFDFEVSFLRIDNLMHHWPFSQPDSIRYIPTSEEGKLALEYLKGNLTWEQAHYKLAERYKERGDFSTAAREYLAVAKVLWHDYYPLMLAGDLMMLIRDYHNAEHNYRGAIERSANQFTVIRIGALHLETGMPDSAVAYFSAGLNIDQRSKVKMGDKGRREVRYHLARAYEALGKTQVAEEILMNILADDPQFTLAQTMLDSLKKGKKNKHVQQ
jgi:tetratricopeptide (TPR) repeat protein